MREKLIDLFKEISVRPEITCPNYQDANMRCEECKYNRGTMSCNIIERNVDYLIANGVSIKSVKGEK